MPDTKKVIRMLNNTLRHCHNLYNHVTSEEQTWLAEINQGAKEALELLKEQPDIVRCKDCKYYGYHNMTNVDGFCYCLKRHEYPHPDWFCADGERMDQDD